MTIILTIIKLLVVLGVVATIHEFGHFLFAKLFKMTVNEFSIGFGPKIVQKQWRETMYSLRWIPLGGYVAIEGEEGDSEDKNAFSNKAPWKRIVVLVAGVLFNAILATIIYTVKKQIDYKQILPVIIGGIVGAIGSSFLLKNINTDYLSKAFAIFLIVMGISSILRLKKTK